MDIFMDMYEKQFKRYLIVAKGFTESLEKCQDRKVCVHWLQRLADLSPSSLFVMTSRNQFLEYFMRVIQEAMVEEILKNVHDQSPLDLQHHVIEAMEITEDPAWLDNELNSPDLKKVSRSTAPYFAHWSHDQKTYIATKAIPGKGMLVYLAVSTEPSLGWSNLAE